MGKRKRKKKGKNSANNVHGSGSQTVVKGMQKGGKRDHSTNRNSKSHTAGDETAPKRQKSDQPMQTSVGHTSYAGISQPNNSGTNPGNTEVVAFNAVATGSRSQYRQYQVLYNFYLYETVTAHKLIFYFEMLYRAT